MMLKKYLFLGFIFSLISVIADHLLLWDSEMNPLNNNFNYLRNLSTIRVSLGVWMGVVGILAESIIFIKIIDELFSNSQIKKYSQLVFILLVTLGVTYHFSIGILHTFVLEQDYLKNALTTFIKPLEILLGFLFIFFNILWYNLCDQSQIQEINKIKKILPLHLFIIGIILFYFQIELGRMILLSGFNLCFALFFLFSLIKENKGELCKR